MPVVIVAWVSIVQSRQLGTHKHFMHTPMEGYFCITPHLLACVKAGTVGFLSYPVTVLLYYEGTIYITACFIYLRLISFSAETLESHVFVWLLIA